MSVGDAGLPGFRNKSRPIATQNLFRGVKIVFRGKIHTFFSRVPLEKQTAATVLKGSLGIKTCMA